MGPKPRRMWPDPMPTSAGLPGSHQRYRLTFMPIAFRTVWLALSATLLRRGRGYNSPTKAALLPWTTCRIVSGSLSGGAGSTRRSSERSYDATATVSVSAIRASSKRWRSRNGDRGLGRRSAEFAALAAGGQLCWITSSGRSTRFLHRTAAISRRDRSGGRRGDGRRKCRGGLR